MKAYLHRQDFARSASGQEDITKEYHLGCRV